jgi:hypothetical protein
MTTRCDFCEEPWADHTDAERRACQHEIDSAEASLEHQRPVGVFYCMAHHGIANEDQVRCDFFERNDDVYGVPCDFRECFIDPHIDARVDREPAWLRSVPAPAGPSTTTVVTP